MSGEGCFYINIKQSPASKLGEAVQLKFQITQHTRDVLLMESLAKILDCGKVYSSRETIDFVVIKFSDIKEKIIPLFDKYPIQGVKSKDFEDFKKVAKLMQSKSHLTREGLDQIKKIKAGMNSARK